MDLVVARPPRSVLPQGVFGIIGLEGQLRRRGPWHGRSLPANAAVLSIALDGRISREADSFPAGEWTIAGPSTRAYEYRATARLSLVMVLVSPAWLQVAGLDVARLVDQRIALREALSPDRTLPWPAPQPRKALVPFIEAVLVALQRAHAVPPDHASRPLSLRQRQRQYRAIHGLPRRSVDDIGRFQAALARLQTRKDLVSVAQDARYADQSHLCRAVRRYVGMTPRQAQRALRDSELAEVYRRLLGPERVVAL
ncbi:AraC family transcriptional regulator [Spiribacter halobius]|nr:AraC family transcriptional regulator [Spiribacter halobius]UEX78197.1 AraC family transcriptional regulator [Spiribacter halobius]